MVSGAPPLVSAWLVPVLVVGQFALVVVLSGLRVAAAVAVAVRGHLLRRS